MDDELRQRIILTLEWLVTDAKWRFDESKSNIDEGSYGGYSPELSEAISLLEDLKEGNTQ